MNKNLLNKILKLDYVQRIELEPGIFTCNSDQTHLGLVNQLLEPIDFQSLACLDIGTRDGGTAFLLEKCGARPVVALDIEDRKQFRLVHKYLQSNVKYITDCHVDDMEDRLSEIQPNNFDIIILSSVLNHVYDIFGTLAQARNLLKPGGLLIVETACIESAESSFYFNNEGYFYNDSYAYWFPTVACFKHLLSLCSFELLSSLKEKGNHKHGDLLRYALTVRAVKPSIAFNGNIWMQKRLDMPYGKDYSRFIERPLDYHSLELEEQFEPIPYNKTIISQNNHSGVMGLLDHIKRKLKI